MNATTTWPISLNQRPRVVAVGRGSHEKGVSRYHLPGLWCLHLYEYHADLLVDGEAYAIRPCSASVLPPGAHLEYRFRGTSSHVWAHFRLPPVKNSTFQAPLLEDLGHDFLTIYREYDRAVGLFPRWPVRTEVMVWNLLWLLVEKREKENQPKRSRVIDQVLDWIEHRLPEPLYGEELARKAGLSHHHLIRLFRAAIGTTPQNYIRQRRVQRARHLLVHSTLPIKAIAEEVGIPDLHLFNKTIRQALGDAPRKIRSDL